MSTTVTGPSIRATTMTSASHRGTAGRPALLDLPPVSLDELTDRAALLTRIDRKYLLPLAAVDALIVALAPDARVLDIGGIRSFRYESVYFDTPDLASYLLAARKRRRRYKVRTRTYLDSDLCWLEVKTQGARGSTVKHRLEYPPDARSTVRPGRDFVDGVLAAETVASAAGLSFGPVLTTRYQRSTLLLVASSSRVTIDTDLHWEHTGERIWLDGHAIVETKVASGASAADRLLWAAGHRPVRISKYATGLAALRPDLPATRWRRTLNRYFARPAGPAGDH